jgi:hypothetical protein
MEKCIPILYCLGVLIFIALIVLAISMDSIEPLEYGIKFNRISRSVEPGVYDSGRYIVGPLFTFIAYPANLVTVEFSDSRKANVLYYNIGLRFTN